MDIVESPVGRTGYVARYRRVWFRVNVEAQAEESGLLEKTFLVLRTAKMVNYGISRGCELCKIRRKKV